MEIKSNQSLPWYLKIFKIQTEKVDPKISMVAKWVLIWVTNYIRAEVLTEPDIY